MKMGTKKVPTKGLKMGEATVSIPAKKLVTKGATMMGVNTKAAKPSQKVTRPIPSNPSKKKCIKEKDVDAKWNDVDSPMSAGG